MGEVKLSWSGAEVDNAQLTVALDGELSKDWKHSFERTVKLLGDGEWGEVQLKKDKVHVSEIAPGSEEKLRHHLEAIVAQANASVEQSESDADGEQEADAGGEKREGPDAEMTERFRAFADAEGKADGEDGDD